MKKKYPMLFEVDKITEESSLISSINSGEQLIKHSGAIHIENSLSLIDRKIANILMKNAFSTMLSAEKHIVRIDDIRKLLGWETTNDQQIKKSLVNLVGTKIKWNIFGKDVKNNEEWVVSTMLASANYKKNKGYCEYSYSYHLRQLFGKPNVYAKIDLLVQKNIQSKHTLAIWEYVIDFICSIGRVCDKYYTEWITVDDLKCYLSIENTKYKSFKEFNRSVLKKSIKEICQTTDMHIESELKKNDDGLNVIRFVIKLQNGAIFSGTTNTTYNIDQDEFKGSLGYSFKGIKKNSLFVDDFEKFENLLVEEYCLGRKKAFNFIREFGIERIKNNLEYVDDFRKQHTIKNLPAFVIKAIEDDYVDNKSISTKLLNKRIELKNQISNLEQRIKKVEDFFQVNLMKEAVKLAKEETNEYKDLSYSEIDIVNASKYEFLKHLPDTEIKFKKFLAENEILEDFINTKKEVLDFKLEIEKIDTELSEIDKIKRKKN